MNGLGSTMKILIAKVLEARGLCPVCSEPMYAWKTKRPDGGDRCAPTCMKCGHKENKLRIDVETNKQFMESIKNKAMNFFKYGSVVPNKELFNKNFENYEIENQEQERVKKLAEKFVSNVVDNEVKHFILSGASGRGKSHMSMAICHEVLKKSNYTKKVLFINYRELLEQIRFSLDDPIAKREIQGNLLKDIKTADLVVLDDLGAESTGKATNFNTDTLYSIVEARQDKALVINTNLNFTSLKGLYGDRICSRILNHSKGFTTRLKETEDQRMKELA